MWERVETLAGKIEAVARPLERLAPMLIKLRAETERLRGPLSELWGDATATDPARAGEPRHGPCCSAYFDGERNRAAA